MTLAEVVEEPNDKPGDTGLKSKTSPVGNYLNAQAVFEVLSSAYGKALADGEYEAAERLHGCLMEISGAPRTQKGRPRRGS